MPAFRNLRRILLVIGCSALVGGCDREGVSTAEITAAAEARVASSLGLTPESTLFTNVYVGNPVDGDVVFCGTVEGERADGTAVPPHRFIAAADPARWVRFDRSEDMSDAPINMAVDWPTICAGEEEVR